MLLLQSRRGGSLRLPFDLIPFRIDVDLPQQLADRFGADAHLVGIRRELGLQLAELLFRDQLFFGQIGLPGIHADVALEIEDLLQLLETHVQERSDAARHALQEPNMRDGRGQFDMAHPFAANLRLDHFDAALVTDDPAMLHPLVLAAVAFPVLDRTENLRAEQPVLFRFERPVIDRLRLLHLAIRPGADFLGRRDADAHRIERDRIPRLFEQCVYAFQGSDLL